MFRKTNKQILITLTVLIVLAIGFLLVKSDLSIFNIGKFFETQEEDISKIEITDQDGNVYQGSEFFNNLTTLESKMFYLQQGEQRQEFIEKVFTENKYPNDYINSLEEYVAFISQDNVLYEDGSDRVPNTVFDKPILNPENYDIVLRVGTLDESGYQKNKEVGLKVNGGASITIDEAVRYEGADGMDNMVHLLQELSATKKSHDGVIYANKKYRLHEVSADIDKAFIDLIYTTEVNPHNMELIMNYYFLKDYVTGYNLDEFVAGYKSIGYTEY